MQCIDVDDSIPTIPHKVEKQEEVEPSSVIGMYCILLRDTIEFKVYPYLVQAVKK